jgi:flagellar biosynthesis/type III secretory pathway M-ring protein FliF/YscJ
MMQQRKPNISRFRSWWQNTSKALNAVIVTPLVALLRIIVSRLRSWWQNTSKKRKIAQIFVLVVVVGLIVSFIGGYVFNWTWTGFGPYTPPTSGLQRGKTLYDWLQLAIIPAAIAFGVWLLNRLQQKRDQQLADQRAQTEREAAEKHADTEREIALDNQREAALQAYIDSMSELLLHKKLRGSYEYRTISATTVEQPSRNNYDARPNFPMVRNFW